VHVVNNLAVFQIYFALMNGDCVSTPLKTLPSNALHSTSLYEFYPYTPKIASYDKLKTNTSLPLVFVFTPADYHLNMWSYEEADNREQLYESAALLAFTGCVPRQIQSGCAAPSDAIPKGVYGSPCVNNAIDTTQCLLYSCDAGYYLNENMTECVARPLADTSKIVSLADFLNSTVFKVVINILLIVALVVLCFCCCIGISCCIVERIAFSNKRASAMRTMRKENVLLAGNHSEPIQQV